MITAACSPMQGYNVLCRQVRGVYDVGDTVEHGHRYTADVHQRALSVKLGCTTSTSTEWLRTGAEHIVRLADACKLRHRIRAAVLGWVILQRQLAVPAHSPEVAARRFVA